MQNIDRAHTLVRQGRIKDAYGLLSDLSDGGDADASLELAHWRMAGDLIRRDLPEARRLFGLAADQGLDSARPCYAALLANGAGGAPRDWQGALNEAMRLPGQDGQKQIELIDAMSLDAQGEPTSDHQPRQLSSQPGVWTFPSFLSADECAYLVGLAQPTLQPSVVVHPQTGQFMRDPIRRSSATSFPFIAEPPALHAINRRIARATGTAYEQGEPTQVLAYDRHEEYKSHSDALAGENNQRILTFLVYLNDGYEGGETHFDAANLSFKGKVGDALLFRNVDAAGQADRLAIHSGRPVLSGRKYLLSKWIRQRPLDLTGPPGRPF